MNFGDLGARFKQAKGGKEADKAADKPYDHAESYRLRARMLGVLVRDARLSAARTLEECARLLNVEPSVVEAWEYGDEAPSLPQLELLAYFLGVPISHFWGQNALDQDRNAKIASEHDYVLLRQRMIGALLRQAREEVGLSQAQLAEAAHLDAERVALYEMGETAIPMNELNVLSGLVKRNMDYFVETAGTIGELLRIREEWRRFTDLDEEVRAFAANPLNLGFIKIAMMFSRLPAEELRKVAEGMLEISM